MDSYRKHILVLRFSALGDVAIASPLIRKYAAENTDVRFTVVSQSFLAPLFDFGMDNVAFHPIDVKSRHATLRGLYRFGREMASLQPDVIADIHGVIRTRLIGLFTPGIPLKRIFKDRKARKSLVRIENKKLTPLKTSMRKYEEVLVRCGLKDLHYADNPEPYIAVREKGSVPRRIGIAPFAKHTGKMWPAAYMEKVVSGLSADGRYELLLFGGRGREAEVLEEWASRYPNVESVAGKYTLAKELEVIKGLDLMLCMDSANMHFASVENVPVVSVWGATHPYAGFYGWKQDPANAVQLDMPCRPCSIYGNKECVREDYACMKDIAPEIVLNKIFALLDGK